MRNTDLREAMIEIAEHAPAPPADLLLLLDARLQRQRRRYALTAAATAVVLVAAAVGGWLALRPSGGVRPAAPTAFVFPALPAEPALFTETWPGATVLDHQLEKPASRRNPDVVGRLDADHLVVYGRPTPAGAKDKATSLWSYSISERKYRVLVPSIAMGPAWPMMSRASNLLAFVQQFGMGRSVVSVTGADGGPAREVASTASSQPSSGVFVHDRSVYFSDGRQVRRYDDATRVVTEMSGFEGMDIDGTVWARKQSGSPFDSQTGARFRNLVTGEERSAARPVGADEFTCVPAFCLGHDQNGWFLERMDGSARAAVPYSGTPQLLGGFTAASADPPDSGLLLVGNRMLVDPVRGRLGAISRTTLCDIDHGFGGRAVAGDLTFRWREMVDGVCAEPAKQAYIGSAD